MTKRLHLNQKGLVHLWLLFLAVVIAVGIVGYVVWQRQEGDQSSHDNVVNVANAKDCGGEWLDTHTHLDDSDVPSTLAQRMKENKVSCAVIFVQMNENNYDEDFELYQEDLGGAPAVFIPFFDVVENNTTKVTREYLEKIYLASDKKIKGLGEFALYREELAGTDLTGEPWNTIYQFAAEKDLFVMIHISPSSEDLAGLEAAMSANPNTKFLIHGFEHGGAGFARLLKDHQNLYFTLDTATFMKVEGLSTTEHYMYPNEGGSKDQFVTAFDTNKNRLLKYAKEEYTQIILAAPDRVMWGTDVSFSWHVEPDVYGRLIEFSKDFKDSLPKDVGDNYAYKNAQRLFAN